MRGLTLLLAVLFLTLSASAEEPEEALSEPEPLLQTAPAALADSREDPNYILVEKTFSGLPQELIPESFSVTVSSSGGESYTLDRENTISQTTDAAGQTLWRWKLVGVGTGTYSVSESGESVEDYSVTKSGEGSVEVKAAELDVFVPVHETTCSHTNWPVKVEGDNNVLFAATLTQGGVAVISKSPLSASQRAAVTKAVLQINGPWKNPVYFYSIEEQIQNKRGFELNGASITYDAAAEEIVIGRTRNWQHVATLQYSVSQADNPEIALHNAYTRSVSAVTVSKTLSGNMADREKRFAFSVSLTLDGEAADFRMNGEVYSGSAQFSLCHGESVRLEEVPVGAVLTVREADYSAERYSCSYSVDHADALSGSTAVISGVTQDGHSILFTNRKDAIPDTLVALDTLPYLLLLGAASLSTLWLIRKRVRP